MSNIICYGGCTKIEFNPIAVSTVEFQVIASGDDESGDFSSSDFYSNGVPQYFDVKESMKSANLRDAKMKEVLFEKDSNILRDTKDVSSSQMIKKNTGKYGSVAFVVRRPGCYMCREQALSITILACKFAHLLEGFNIFGVIKEVGVDDEGLYEFQKDYFPFPLFCDTDKEYYKALGDRKTGGGFRSSFKLASNLPSFMKRAKDKQITGNFIGEGFLQGGLIFFNSKGEAKFAYEEETGAEIPLNDVLVVLEEIRKDQSN